MGFRVKLWQVRSCLADVKLAGDYICDQAGAVFLEQFDFVFCAIGISDYVRDHIVKKTSDSRLFVRKEHRNSQVF